MKSVTLLTKDKHEADAVRTAWGDPLTRAWIVVMGTLQQLPSDRGRQRVLRYVLDTVEEQREAESVRSDDQTPRDGHA